MTSAPIATAPVDTSATTDALTERLFAAAIAALELETVHLGDRLGYYKSLRESGPINPAAFAKATGTADRYAREWLEQQASAGFITVDDSAAPEQDRRYSLPAGYDAVLVDPVSPNYMPWAAAWAVACAQPMDAIVEAFKTGGGVPWEAYGEAGVRAQAAGSRPNFVHSLASEWLPGVPGLAERLQSGEGARVADVATGGGWAAIEMARAFPGIKVDGLDLDSASIALANDNLRGSGVEDRVTFQVRDAGDPQLAGKYDLVTIFEAVHDMSHPVEALRGCKGLLAPGGVFLIMDENVDDEFRAPGTDYERLLYGFSVLTCLPAGMDAPGAVGTGTVIRPSKLREYAKEAGFSEVIDLPIANDFFRFYQLLP
ncbi:MAG: class I SAM-dependent methyltransferase [Dehalococcoidia bacterium]